MEVEVECVRTEARAIKLYELRPLNEPILPAFTAGAHVDLFLPNGMSRSYSLCNPQSERNRYVIAVSIDRNGRGGSSYIHERIVAGTILSVSHPMNNFPLDETAEYSVFIAGGIGITPIWCMLSRLSELGRSWELHYCARTKNDAAFLRGIDALGEDRRRRVSFNFDYEPGGRLLDIGSVVAAAPSGSHIYCCGPAQMLQAFERAAEGLPSANIHTEYFSPRVLGSREGGFTVVLARTGHAVAIPKGKTILQALLDEGIDVPHSCTEGTCGSCETVVLKGVPDHRDSILSESERSRNETMMICCSGCIGETLVLDL